VALPHIHTAENIRAGMENSLRLMKTDHLDAVQFHRSIRRREPGCRNQASARSIRT